MSETERFLAALTPKTKQKLRVFTSKLQFSQFFDFCDLFFCNFYAFSRVKRPTRSLSAKVAFWVRFRKPSACEGK